MSLQVWMLEAAIALAILVGSCVATWFAAEAHYSQDLSSLEGQLEGAAMAQKAAVTQQIAMDQQAAKEVDIETQQQIGSMADVISDLSVRLQHASANTRTITVRAAAPSPAVACVKPDRPAIAASSRSVAEPQKPVEPAAAAPQAAISADILDGVLTVGIDALKAELLCREFLRKTGQTKSVP